MKVILTSMGLKRFSIVLILAGVVIATPSHAADLKKGKELFDARCASCHGATGLGDGPVGAALPPEMKPRNLKEAKMKFATDDTKFKELLKKGGAAVGLNPLMPAQADLNDADADSIIAYVHSLHG